MGSGLLLSSDTCSGAGFSLPDSGFWITLMLALASAVLLTAFSTLRLAACRAQSNRDGCKVPAALHNLTGNAIFRVLAHSHDTTR